MKAATALRQGQLVANFLKGSWRTVQEKLDMSVSDLELVTALLYNSGGAGLAWWRIHESELSECPSGELLHQGYRLQSLQTAIQEERIVVAFGLLRAAGIEPILVKGWAAARFYSHASLRPYGDVDLIVKPSDFVATREVLAQSETATWWIDLHQTSRDLSDRTIDELFARSREVTLRDSSIRLLCEEDHLALLAMHLFKHSAWRPSWLCDIAAQVESLPAGFDWQLCLGTQTRQAAWVSLAIALAQRLLDANIDQAPSSLRDVKLPAWLVDAVLRQWGNLFESDRLPVQPRPLMLPSLRRPGRLLQDVIARWPDPIAATFSLRAQPNDLPRLPYQIGAFASRAGQYLIDHLSGAAAETSTG